VFLHPLLLLGSLAASGGWRAVAAAAISGQGFFKAAAGTAGCPSADDDTFML
jgi:hypothetical protein